MDGCSLLPILLWKVQKFAMPVHNWKITLLHVVHGVILWTSCDRVADDTAAQKDSVPVSTKKRVQIEQFVWKEWEVDVLSSF